MLNNIISGANVFSTPLISFDTIVDEDISLLSYIIMHVRNDKYFDFDKIKDLSPMRLLKEVYWKRYINPLYMIMRDESDKEFLDECYKEFLDNGEYLKYYSIGTDFYKLVKEFAESPEIKCTILCRNEEEIKQLKEDPVLSKVEIVTFEEIKKEYTQYYFKYIEDSADFINNKSNKTYYFSSTCSNLTEDNTDVRESNIINTIISNHNSISIFDMYKQDKVGKVIQ